MNFYFWTTILTELMMLTMILHVLNYSGFKKIQKTWYLLTFIAVMLCSGAEFAVHCGYYSEKFSLPLTILTAIQFSVAPLLCVLFSGALGMNNKAKVVGIYLGINLLVEIVAAPFGRIFYFDAEGYHRGDLFFIYGIFYFSSLVYLLVSMIIVGKRFRHRDFYTIGMVLVVLIAGIIPMTFFHINVTYMAVAISASLCYIYYNDLVQQDIKAELIANQQKISEMQLHIISGLANLIENRDMETGEHISRTSAYVKMLAEYARNDGIYATALTDHFISLIYTLAPMHDIGKIMIPDRILKKPGKLTEDEFTQMKKHAEAGGTIVREVLNGITDEEYITFAANIATYHHERWDGTGYPANLKGKEIPIAARIMAIADVFDALISERCYKKAVSAEDAIKIIKEESGTHFDPQLIGVFLNHKDAFINFKR
ncbi:MAG: HD domain-containing protein [Clostridia bacterium]|nr:HD domain-containing protein [Clostridia bacterium]